MSAENPTETTDANAEPPVEIELSKEQITDITTAFEQFDTDKDGFIDKDEMASTMRSLMQAPTENQICNIFQEMDRDNHGVIDLDDFSTIMSRNMKSTDALEKILKEAFLQMDPAKCGTLNVNEFRTTMTTMGDVLTENEVDELLKELTIDKEGRLDYEEFIGVVMRR